MVTAGLFRGVESIGLFIEVVMVGLFEKVVTGLYYGIGLLFFRNRTAFFFREIRLLIYLER